MDSTSGLVSFFNSQIDTTIRIPHIEPIYARQNLTLDVWIKIRVVVIGCSKHPLCCCSIELSNKNRTIDIPD
jgi:hypothetical protein